MNKATHILMAAALAVGGLAVIGCDDTSSTTSTTPNGATVTTETKTTETRTSTAANPTPGDRVENALEKTGDALKNAANKTGDAVDRAVDKTGSALRNAGESIKGTVNDARTTSATGPAASADTDSVNGVREQISEIAEAALTKDGLDNVRRRLADNDQSRLAKMDNKDEALNQLVNSIRTKWKDKYGHDFDMDAKVALNDPFLSLGGVDARTAGERTTTDTNVTLPKVNADVDRTNNGVSGSVNVTPGSIDTSHNATANHASAGDRQTVTIPASHGMPALNLTMVKQDASWKLDLPDTVDAATLIAGLKTHLGMVDNMSAQWPADENEAYRAVTHHVLTGLSGMAGGSTPAIPQ